MPEPPAAPASGAAGHGSAPLRGQDERAAGRGGRFGRMFPGRAAANTSDDAINALVARIAVPQAHGDNLTIPAGFTYLGQFIDHDITFDPTSKLDRDNDPLALVNFRTPRFDLDSVYGSGPDDQPYLYEWSDQPNRGVKLLVGRSPEGVEDLPRNRQGIALIGDARNDENLLVSQLHLLFLRFHNAVVDHVRDEDPGMEPRDVFDRARELVRWHYQWIVTHDFLERVVGERMARDVLRHGAVRGEPATVVRRFFTWDEEPAIPVEFSGAAYRFGHSMVRPSYFLQRDAADVKIFPPADGEPGDEDLSGFRDLPAALEVKWDLFFFDEPITGVTNSSLNINNRITPELFAVPGRGALPRLNLQRGRRLGLPSGQTVADAMEEPPLHASDLQLGQIEPAHVRDELRTATPLWYYVLCEAGTGRHGEGGRHLGPVGGRIVAEVLVGLLEGDPSSYLARDPAWRPTLRSASPGDFTMRDLVAFAEGRTP